jgi:hypothetical protein
LDSKWSSRDFLNKAQWKSGAEVAEFLDAFFTERGWAIEPTSPYQERALHLGDRLFMRDMQAYFVEYKSGIQTGYRECIPEAFSP